MSSFSKLPGILILVFIVALSILSFRSSLPPAVIPAEDTASFSAERAMTYLREVARAPHPGGTPEHTRVRNYIADYCRQKGLEVEIQSGIDFNNRSNSVTAAFVHNVIATLKGTQPGGKAILVASHYDSQLNTAAAADDGAGVAAKMEVIDMLTRGERLQNDVIFLFTDMEEFGLDGAAYFVDNYAHIDDIGLVLNFEARGNRGTAYSFETTSENGWMMREFKKAVKKPISNSLAYEIYKLMPNGTDFTEFKRTGVTGINSAFIDGWAYYHSAADTPENISLKSVQHHGDHMIGMLRHFGNMDLSNTKESDVIFFNPFGSWLLLYPGSVDLPLIILTVIVWIAGAAMGKAQNRIRWKTLFASAGLMLLSLVLAMLLLYGYQQLIGLISDPGSTLAGNFKYRMGNVLWVILGLALIAFSIVFKKVIKGSYESAYMGALLFSILLIIPVKIFASTGGYILYFPVLIAAAVYLAGVISDTRLENKPVPYTIGQMISIFVPIGLWIPMAYMIYIVFGMGLPFGSMLFLVFFFPFLIPAYKMVSQINPKLVLYLGLVLVLFGQLLQFFSPGYTETTPRETNLNYVVDADKGEAWWHSHINQMDEWKTNFLGQAEEVGSDVLTLNSDRQWLTRLQKTTLTDTSFMKFEVIADDTVSNTRQINLQIVPAAQTNTIRMRLPKGTFVQTVAGANAGDGDSRSGNLYLNILAVPKDTFNVSFTIPANSESPYRIQERRLGLPQSLLITPMPADMVHGPYNSNLTLIDWRGEF